MKPLNLVMSAFGPFKSKVEIPFKEYGSSGLFLVTGDTGAGKTTIFDAISFALFGNASGENRTPDCFRSDFSGNEDKTYVELTFLHRNKTYRVLRNPLYLRNKLKGDGTTQEKANAVLTMPDGSVISGYYPVTEAITDLLGIDWKQYKQIAMIAQGEFLQLLTSDSSERGIIFRKVFGTEVYDDIQKKLKNMSNALRYRCEDLDKSMLQFLSGIICDLENVPEEGPREQASHYKAIEDWKASMDIHQVPKIMELLAVLLEADKQRYKSEHKNSELLKAKINEKSIEHTNALRDNEMLQNLKNTEEAYGDLLKSSKEIHKTQIMIQSAQKALYTVKPVESIYLRVEDELTRLNDDISNQTEEIKRTEEQRKACQKIWEEKAADELKVNELTLQIKRQEDELKKYQFVKEFEAEISDLYKKRQSAQQSITQLNMKKAELAKELEEKQKEQEGYGNPERDILECQNDLASYDRLIARLNKIIEDLADFKEENNHLENLQIDYRQAEESYQKKNGEYMKEETLFFREQAGLLAASLSEGEPCPVCGSLHHPNKAIITNGAPSEDILKKDKLKLEAAHQQLIEAGKNCSNQKTKVDMLNKQLQNGVTECFSAEKAIDDEKLTELFKNNYPQDKLSKVLEEKQNSQKIRWKELKEREENLQIKCNQKNSCIERLSQISVSLQKLNEQLDENKDALTIAVNQSGIVEGKLSTLRNDLKFANAEEAKKALETDRKNCNELQEGLKKAKEDLQNYEALFSKQKAVLEDNQKKLDQKKTEFINERKAFEEKLKQSGFETDRQYQEALCEEAELENLIHKVEAYQKSCDSMKTQIEQLKAETLHKVEKNPDDIKLQQEKLEKLKSDSEELMQKIYSRIKMNSDIYYRAGEIFKEQEAARQEYMIVSDLSKTANGELSGKAKIAFEQYVQAFYFNSVINEANKRLYKMSNNQFVLRRKEDPSNLRMATGLELEVMDYYTGKPRSVKSLSGGESFKAALSLALGLSDVIQSYAGGIDVDAMFIDEGFGSLDSNSLEQAINTLSALTAGNRFIGIISHVSELKERIDKKIFIEKGMDGSRLTLLK